jgi:hypothetical protein
MCRGRLCHLSPCNKNLPKSSKMIGNSEMAGRKSGFLRREDQTDDYEQAVSLLRKLPSKLRECVFAEFMQDSFDKILHRYYGEKVKTSAACWWGWLLRKQKSYMEMNTWPVPAQDHVIYHEKNGKRTIVSQPYGLSLKDLKEIVEFCEEKQIDARVEACAPHYPGRTVAVIYSCPQSQ